MRKKILIVIGIGFIAFFATALLLPSLLRRVKPMEIDIINLESQYTGLLDVRLKVECDAINYGRSGYATIVAESYDDENFSDREEQRIHLRNNEQRHLTFDLDIKVKSEEILYKVYASNIQPD
jgi:hypothetical protein